MRLLRLPAIVLAMSGLCLLVGSSGSTQPPPTALRAKASRTELIWRVPALITPWPRVRYYILTVKPDPRFDYKILKVLPDPRIDYKIIRVIPICAKRGLRPPKPGQD